MTETSLILQWLEWIVSPALYLDMAPAEPILSIHSALGTREDRLGTSQGKNKNPSIFRQQFPLQEAVL